MTINHEIDQVKEWKTPTHSSQNVDTRMLEFVHLIARRAAQNDFEKILEQDQSKTIH